MRAGLPGTASSSDGTGIRKPGDPKWDVTGLN